MQISIITGAIILKSNYPNRMCIKNLRHFSLCFSNDDVRKNVDSAIGEVRKLKLNAVLMEPYTNHCLTWKCVKHS